MQAGMQHYLDGKGWPWICIHTACSGFFEFLSLIFIDCLFEVIDIVLIKFVYC
jgi:hypothetical protein